MAIGASANPGNRFAVLAQFVEFSEAVENKFRFIESFLDHIEIVPG